MRRWLPIAALALCAAAPASAGATVFDVRNERGIPQATYYWVDGVGPFLGSGDGRTDISDLAAGDVVRFSRAGGAGGCTEPEGAGVSYTVPAGAPAEVPITLPVTTGPSWQPESSDAERWIVGQLNRRRAERGLPPLTISATLGRAADAVARDSALQRAATGTFPFPPPFCDVIHIDWGWPGSGFTLLDQKGADPRGAFEHWSDGSVRETSGTLGNWDAVGVGDGGPGGAFIAYFSRCPATFAARCELSGDQGDPNVVLPEPPAGDPPGGGGGPGGSGPGGSGPGGAPGGRGGPGPGGAGGPSAKPLAGEAKKLGRARSKVSSRRRFASTIVASCTAPGGCFVSAAAVKAGKTLARGGFRLAAGRSRRVKLTVNAAGRAALRRSERVRMPITVTVRSAGHRAATMKRTVVVSASRR